MPGKLSKMTPIAVVAGILGYLCWPYFDDPTAAKKSKTSAKTAESLASLLNPTPAGDVRNNLFEIPQVVGPGGAKKGSTAAGEAAGAKKAAAAAARGTDEFKNFVLSGTYVTGGSRYAVINGSPYTEGEQIKASGRGAKTTPTSYTVSHVEIDKVVLSFQGQTKELHFADPSAAPEQRSGSARPMTSAVETPKDRSADGNPPGNEKTGAVGRPL